MTYKQLMNPNLYNAHRYIACARRWRIRGDLGAAALYLSKAARARRKYAAAAN